MNVFSLIEQRWGFVLPEEYKALARAGILDYESPDYLRLTYVRWYYPPKVEGQDIPEYWKPGIVPFAASPAGDKLCWVLDWQTHRGTGTAYCVRSSSSARGYEPDFAGAIYRAMLEEFLSSFLEESSPKLAVIFRQYVDRVAPVLPTSWVQTLGELVTREPQFGEDGGFIVSEGEVQGIIERDLAFSHLNVRFQYTR